jgi:hypothetical protein
VRQKAQEKGKILFFDRPCFVECAIKNISKEGALLRLFISVALPSEILLWTEHTGRLYRCRLRWRKDQFVGVQFAACQSRDATEIREDWKHTTTSETRRLC